MSLSNLTRTTAQHRAATITVVEVAVDLDVRGARTEPMFDVTSTITLVSTTEQVQVDFLDGEVDQVLLDGIEQPVVYDGASVQVSGITGGEHQVTIRGRGRYSRTGQGLHRFTDPSDGNTYLYSHCEPSDSRRIYPQFDQPDMKTRVRFTITAPAGWVVLSNQPGTRFDQVDEQTQRVEFAPTPLISSYLTAVAAGPYHRVTDRWTSPDGLLEIDLGLQVRASRADSLDAEELFKVTKQGLDYYHQTFGGPDAEPRGVLYPWGKYDQIFVPEYNLGAMENPGLVTFTETYLFRSRATRSQYATRTNTLLHEMAHMWFGDLVTPKWWDDLWLKESFAEFMGSHAEEQATEFTESWVSFAGRRKTWAFAQDQVPTTHPIVADIPDVQAARQNFDGITYAKGAAVLKQLVATVGVDEFFAASRAYFDEHAFGNTVFADLARALEAASGRDLGAWTTRWLTTSGPDELTGHLEVRDGRIERAAISQRARVIGDRPIGGPVPDEGGQTRPHRLKVGLYARQNDQDQGDQIVRVRQLDVEVDAPVTELDELVGQQAPDLMLINDEDWTYAVVVLDPHSLRTALDQLADVADPLARALLWTQLYGMVRDGTLPVTDYVEAVQRHAPREDDTATMVNLFANAHQVIEQYLPAERRDPVRAEYARALVDLAGREDLPNPDAPLVIARASATAVSVVPELADHVRALLAGDGLEQLGGQELRWLTLRAGAAIGAVDRADLDAELARDDTMDGRLAHLAAVASLPTPEAKQEVLGRVLGLVEQPDSMSNDELDAALIGLNNPLGAGFLTQVHEQYFDLLDLWWDDLAIEIAQRMVRGLYPGASTSTIERANAWLDAHADAPRALRRVILEETDHAARALRVRQANEGDDPATPTTDGPDEDPDALIQTDEALVGPGDVQASDVPADEATEVEIDTVERASHTPDLEQPWQALGLKLEEYQRIGEILGRRPTSAELAMYSVMWSEHCSYKSSRKHLSRFGALEQTTPRGPLLAGIGDNAGVVDIGQDYAITFKVESHNHPSYVEPHQGAATGVGGIVRDILAMGARPIAVMDSLRFGPLDAPDTARVLPGVVAGVGGYGNCLGLPNIGGEVDFDPSYAGNPLVNALGVGLLRHHDLHRAVAQGAGNQVIMFGAATGGDGIGGASILASESFDQTRASKRPAVQVGDPFMEKLLIECTLELFSEGLVAGIQDFGAAGISCATSELAAAGDGGMAIQLDRVILRDPTLAPEEILMSESQERMMAVVEPAKVERFLQICRKWQVEAAVVGEVTDGDRLVIDWHGQRIVDVDPLTVASQGPVYDRPSARPEWLDALQADAAEALGRATSGDELRAQALAVTASPHVADKSWITDQYDRYVRGNSVLAQPEDAGLLRIDEQTHLGIALSLDGNGRFGQLDPVAGAQISLAEAYRNVATTGAEPVAVTDCLNFGSPEDPGVMWQFIETIKALVDGCRALGTPVTGGNVSFYNQTSTTPILPTPTIGVLGVIDDVRRHNPIGFAHAGDAIVLLGRTQEHLSGSVWADAVHQGHLGGRPPQVDWQAEKALAQVLRAAAEQQLLSSAHDLADGGLWQGLVESVLRHHQGASLTLPDGDPTVQLFSETPGRVVVSLPAQSLAAVQRLCAEHDVPMERLGEVTGEDELEVIGQFSIGLDELDQCWRRTLPAAMASAREA